MTDAWKAPVAPGPLDARVILPGSKSETIRALVLGATSQKPLLVQNALLSRDTLLAARALESLGVEFDSRKPDELLVTGPDRFRLSGSIDCGLAGTVMRFIPALATFGDGSVRFDGDSEARVRPLGDLLRALESLGAQVSYEGETGMLPFVLTGRGPGMRMPGSIGLDSSATSQYLSALLLAGPAAPEAYTVELSGKVPSAAHIEMTQEMLEDQGISSVHTGKNGYLVSNRKPAGNPIRVEADLSNAGPFLAAPLVVGGTVRLQGWPAQTTQPGEMWKTILPHFGATVLIHGEDLVVQASGERWRGIDLDLSRAGELTPTLAALCALATSESRLRGIGHLRGHETDRLAALVEELGKFGVEAEETSDGLIIRPGSAQPTDFSAYADHRMATFGALLGLAVPGCTVDDIECTSKTLPDFAARWEAMLSGADPVPAPSLSEELSTAGRRA